MWLKLVTERVESVSCSLCEISRIAVARRLRTMVEAWWVESMMRWVVSAEMSRVPADDAQLREKPAPAEKPVECPAAAAPLNIPYSPPPAAPPPSPSASGAPAPKEV